MKILHLTYSLQQGGAERLIVDLLNDFSKIHEVYLCTLWDDKNTKHIFFKNQLNKNIKYVNLGSVKEFKLKNVYLILKLINKLKPEIVHTHLGLFYYSVIPALYFRRIKFFHTIHSDALTEIENKKFRPIRRYFFKNEIIRAITISNESQRSYRQFYNLKNSYLIYNGRELPQKSPLFKNVQKEIMSFKKNEDDLVFLHVGRFDWPKNHQLLIDVFNQLLDEGNHLILLILGMDFDSKGAESLKNRSKPGIYFISEKTNVADYYLNADAFCLSSIAEGLPITLLEALACGCVPICTSVGGIKDVIRDGINGYLDPEITIQSYYKTVKRFINRKNDISKEKLIQYFQENFSIEKCVKEHYEIYSQ